MVTLVLRCFKGLGLQCFKFTAYRLEASGSMCFESGFPKIRLPLQGCIGKTEKNMETTV